MHLIFVMLFILIWPLKMKILKCFWFVTGNKRDLEDKREVLFEDACKLADDRGLVAALETSAKDARSVEEAFVMIAQELLLRNGMKITQEDSRHDSTRVILRTNSRSIDHLTPDTTDKKSCDCWHQLRMFWLWLLELYSILLIDSLHLLNE